MKTMFYPLPGDIENATECVEISFCVPCDQKLLEAVRGAIWSLTKWWVWQRDENRTGSKVAQCLRHWLEDTYEEC